jgi:hypothetical protein
MIRPFELQDLPALRRLSPQGICLDTCLGLTGDVRPLQSALWASLFPGSLARTYVWQDPQGVQAYAQFRRRTGSPLARLTFIAPRAFLLAPWAGELVEGLLAEAGRIAAQHLLVEAEEGSEVFGFLRRECFAVYARQTLWIQEAPLESPPLHAGTLRPELARDAAAVRSLYAAVVPGMVQQLEPPPHSGRGWVLVQEGELVGYLHIRRGQRGTWVEPFFHPAARDVAEATRSFLSAPWAQPVRPLYVCVRSYQDWLGAILQHAGLRSWGEQAVMVRRVVVPIREARTVPVPAIEHGATRATPIRGQ